MSWQRRIQELVAAGGTLAVAACSNGLPCGNANPDPCICNRSWPTTPQCVAEQECRSHGGVWSFDQPPPDGGLWGQCEPAGGTIIDADSGGIICNPLSQSGCAAGQKCAWVVDQLAPQQLGHVDCVPDGPVPLGGSCQVGSPGATGYDNCAAGAVCWNGVCEPICDPFGGAPSCDASTACITHDGLFASSGQPLMVGVCERRCDPLADNDLLGSGSRPGSACAAGSGCYGYPAEGPPSAWTCWPVLTTVLVHRMACTLANGCDDSAGNPRLNGCAPGYIPLLHDATGSMQVDCIAVCEPGNTYAGNPGTQYPAGQSPHTCSTTDARGTFDTATLTNNGDHCTYSWRFEVDASGVLHRSPTSDTVGFCVDHSKYRYDSNGDGTIDSSDAVWPLCASLADGSAAAQFGCVDTMHAGLPPSGATALRPLDVRLPYGPMR